MSGESPQLFAIKPFAYVPVVVDHPWVLRFDTVPRKKSEDRVESAPTASVKQSPVKENLLTLNGEKITGRRKASKYSSVRSKITPEDTKQFLERKKLREKQRKDAVIQKEVEELQECTFHPIITRTFKYV